MFSHHHRRERAGALDPPTACWPSWKGRTGHCGWGRRRATPVALLRPSCADVLWLWPVNTRVNAPKNNNPMLLDPAVEAGQGDGPNPA